MSLAVVFSRGLAGVESPLVTVEADLANGLPTFNIVGLAEAEVKESRDRVRSAIVNCGFEFPARRITVNLAPADLPKESGRFDLPIAVGILAASNQIPPDRLADHEFAGELSLNGELRSIRGALAMTVPAAASGRTFVLPSASAPEAALVSGARVLAADSLAAVAAHLTGAEPLPEAHPVLAERHEDRDDFRDVKGQAAAKRALEVAAAGRHSILLYGPPGTGKSMLAQRLPAILPAMTDAEALESAAVRSLASGGFRAPDWRRRPFRSPHHSASSVALVGGGSDPRPGEISLAHHGVLFLDELPEFDRRVLEVLREPLESGRVAISRAARQCEFPARFQLVAAMNPCPCGYLGHPQGDRCRCTPDQIARYRGKLSGPLLDRIDMHVEVPALTEAALLGAPDGEPSATLRGRVDAAHTRQLARQGAPNAALAPSDVEVHCRPEPAAEALLRSAISKLSLSARAYHRILKVARTIADLADAEAIAPAHVAEAVQYRKLDRGVVGAH